METDLDGLTDCSFISILPFLHAADAKLRVLKIRTAQSHLSIRIESLNFLRPQV